MEFVYYFAEVATPMSMALLVGGTIGGLILGATPGLSPTMAVALLIPFTFYLTPVHGLILLGCSPQGQGQQNQTSKNEPVPHYPSSACKRSPNASMIAASGGVQAASRTGICPFSPRICAKLRMK